MEYTKRIILALDRMSMRTALNLVAELGPMVKGFKAHGLIDRYGNPTVASLLREECPSCWLWDDIKGLDTDDTIEDRAKQLAQVGLNAITVHAIGKPKMIAEAAKSGLYIIAVTLLSSWEDTYVKEWFKGEPDDIAFRLALQAKENGAKAIVCSPKQILNLSTRPQLFDMDFIVPGTRSAGVTANDQAQVDTPLNTMKNGATYLVGGRQITQSDNPRGALMAMGNEIRLGVEERAKAQRQNWLETFSG